MHNERQGEWRMKTGPATDASVDQVADQAERIGFGSGNEAPCP